MVIAFPNLCLKLCKGGSPHVWLHACGWAPLALLGAELDGTLKEAGRARGSSFIDDPSLVRATNAVWRRAIAPCGRLPRSRILLTVCCSRRPLSLNYCRREFVQPSTSVSLEHVGGKEHVWFIGIAPCYRRYGPSVKAPKECARLPISTMSCCVVTTPSHTVCGRRLPSHTLQPFAETSVGCSHSRSNPLHYIVVHLGHSTGEASYADLVPPGETFLRSPPVPARPTLPALCQVTPLNCQVRNTGYGDFGRGCRYQSLPLPPTLNLVVQRLPSPVSTARRSCLWLFVHRCLPALIWT